MSGWKLQYELWQTLFVDVLSQEVGSTTNVHSATMEVISMDQNACTGAEAEHDYAEKAKARKSGRSLLKKSEELADKANVFATAVYWDPTHKCHRIAARLPKGETMPDLNRLVAEALAGRLPEPRAQPKKKRGPSKRRTNATGAGRRSEKTQQVQRPLRRSARMHQTRASDAVRNNVYTSRGDSEGALEAEDTNGGSRDSRSGSDSGYYGRESGSHRDFHSVPERSPVNSDLETSVRRQFDLSRAATQRGGAADNPLPGSTAASAAEGDIQIFGQSIGVMNPLDEPFFNNHGADMVVTEAVAAPPFLGVAQREDVSVAALRQPRHQLVPARASSPRPLLASDAWRNMAQNALGTVNLLLAPDTGIMQAELGMPPLQHGWTQQGQVVIR